MTYRYRALTARQSSQHRVLVFTAKAKDVLAFSEIDRVGRTKSGGLRGFQRPRIASHISEIRDYLSQGTAVLPNSIVVAFVDGIRVQQLNGNSVQISINTKNGKPGFIVDGQQRLSALSELERKDFEIFVSCIVCKDYEELRRQFILVNNTRPLPKSLIYELLPAVNNLPRRYSCRTFASRLTERLNHDLTSALRGKIQQQTNPEGVIKDTAIQKVIMYSASDGAIREFSDREREAKAFQLLSNFYEAVQDVFPVAWRGHAPRTSRLVHGAGIIAMGFVMEAIHARTGRIDRQTFKKGLKPLVGRTAWTSGQWRFAQNEVVPWNRLENVPRQIAALAGYLVTLIRRSTHNRRTRGRAKTIAASSRKRGR